MRKQTKKSNEANIVSFVKQFVLSDFPDMDDKTAINFIDKAYSAQLIESTNENCLHEWYENKFKKNIFELSEDQYTEAAIQSLKIQSNIAGTDFGTARQRDLGQKWSDTIRGYLGELGTKQIFKRKYNIEISLGHEKGNFEKHLPTDIHKVKFPNKLERDAKIKVSIKTTKSNGIWLDIPGDQYNHSDIHMLVLIGVDVNHLFGFFKEISVFKDKVLKKGIEKNCITQDEAEKIYNEVPSFKKIYGYVPGIIKKESIYENYLYEGKKGKTNFEISNWCGRYEKEYLDDVKKEQSAKTVKFKGIGEFSQSNRYIFGLRSLISSDNFWENELIKKL